MNCTSFIAAAAALCLAIPAQSEENFCDHIEVRKEMLSSANRVYQDSGAKLRIIDLFAGKTESLISSEEMTCTYQADFNLIPDSRIRIIWGKNSLGQNTIKIEPIQSGRVG